MLTKNKKIKKSSRYQNIIFSILIGIFIFAVAGFLIISNLKINQKRGEMISKIEELSRQIQILEEKNERLRAGLIEAETDIYWEERLREQGFALPGEEQIVVLPPENDKAASAEQEKERVWLAPLKALFEKIF